MIFSFSVKKKNSISNLFNFFVYVFPCFVVFLLFGKLFSLFYTLVQTCFLCAFIVCFPYFFNYISHDIICVIIYCGFFCLFLVSRNVSELLLAGLAVVKTSFDYSCTKSLPLTSFRYV